jgi:tungstate transport system ATP-binding protein
MSGQWSLALDGVQLRAGNVAILDGISITISPGAPTILIGPNGCGKTTLLRVAMGLMAPSQGRITWSDTERSAPPRRAIMFQRPVMLRRSVAGNLLFSLQAAGVPAHERKRRAEELLRLVGLESSAPRAPSLFSLHSPDFSGRPARRLSGGEQQRLALARALARDPAVLFLDEPTASLDPAATKVIEDIIRTLAARGIKIVMATHDLGEARRLAGEIVLMHRGSVVESGPAERFFSGPVSDWGRRFIAGELLT